MPIAISDTYISASVIPAISVECLNGSLYDYVHSLGISTSHVDQELRALLPTEEQKRLLEADDIALLCSSHVTYTMIDGVSVPFEYHQHLLQRERLHLPPHYVGLQQRRNACVTTTPGGSPPRRSSLMPE